ncbi:efflux RND transporter periplasmic adaptor subunit [Myroides sp. LJL115]
MKKSILYFGFALSLLSLSCTTKDKTSIDTIDSTSQEQQENASLNKEVELNNAQFKAAGITLGQIQDRNLSDVLRVNGLIKLPAKDQADVTSFLGGTVTQINVNVGQHVTKGQTLAMIESPEFIQLQEQYLVSKNNLDYLELEYQRQQTLREQNVNSQKIYQKTKSDLNVERARYQSLTNQLKLLNVAPGSSAASMRITAPITGNIASIDVKIGTNIAPGQSLFNVVDNTKVHLDLMVFEKDLAQIKVGQTVSFNLTNNESTPINATIFSIGNAFEPGTKTVAVHANIEKTDQTLVPGFYVNALVNLGDSKVPSLPNTAIVKAEGKEFIFVVEDQTKEEYHFERIEVKTGTSELGYTQVSVLMALPEDPQIALTGAYYIQSHLIKNEGGGGHDH